MGSKGGGYEAPDPREAARAQGAANVQTALTQARVNMVNQQTPFGNITYTPVPGATQTVSEPWGVDNFRDAEYPNQFQASVELTPNQQALLDMQERLGLRLGDIGEAQLDNIGSTLEQPLDFSQFGPVPGSSEAGGRNALEEALLARLQPSIDQDRARFEAGLANQGINLGSEARSNAVRDFEMGVNDARMTAVINAQVEQDRQMRARQQAINETLLRRSVPINEITALAGGQQVQLPGQAAAPSPQTAVQPPDYLGATYNSAALEQQQQALQGQQQGGLFGGLFGLGGSLGAASILRG